MPPIVQNLIDRLGGRQRALFIGAGLAGALLIFGVARYATRPEWVPLFTGVPLEAVGTITQKLEEEGIAYRLENGGAELKVQAPDIARARVLLAKDGLPETGRPGLELFDQPSWGMTDFSQRINYRRALEGELERTIGKMRGIEVAQVHLALHESSSFRRADRPAEASVVLKLRSGATPAPDVVQGIAHLVASSVDGLESERVAVLDDGGRLLSTPEEPGTPAALTNRQLALQREVEGHLERKAEQMVSQIVGPGNARVQVAAAINFDRVERTVETLDPERQVVASEQRAEIIPGAEGGAGSSNEATTYENSRSLETYAGATGTVKRLSVAVLVNDRPASASAGGAGGAYEPRTPEELARIEALVRSAVGVDAARGDAVSVVSIPFDGAAALPADAPASVSELVQSYHRPALMALALLFAFVVALRVVRTLKPEPAAAAVPALGAGGAEAEGAAPALTAGAPAEADAAALAGGRIPERIIPVPLEPLLPVSNPMQQQVAASVEHSPETAARLVRAWLREA